MQHNFLTSPLQVFHASKGGAEAMCRQMGMPLLGRVPLDPGLGRAAEEGRSAFQTGDADGNGDKGARLLLPSSWLYLNTGAQY